MLPYLGNIESKRAVTKEFRGYNHNLRITDNEFFDTGNITADEYPVMSTRKRRSVLRTLTKPNGLYAHNKLCWVDGINFYYDGVIKGTVADSKKTIVGMGAYVLIFPDAKYYNANTDEFGNLGNQVDTDTTVSVTLTNLTGTEYENYTVSETAPAEPTDGQLWIDTSETPHVLKQYVTATVSWASIPTTYVKIAATGIGVGFAEFDGVTISGMNDESLNGNFILHGVSDNWIILTGIIDAVFTQNDPVTIIRDIPSMDFVTEWENRIWGCSSDRHEIYACVLGDPKNWSRYLGIATDSYSLTVGSTGNFTGCATHSGYVCFFKTNTIHKIYGSKPSNYQLTNTTCRGVEAGSDKSLCVINECLYYKSWYDICAYTSALPQSISAQLGTGRYHGAVSGSNGKKLYISMLDESDNPIMLSFDTIRGIWCREDDIYAEYFASLGDELYFISGNSLCAVNGTIDKYADETAHIEDIIPWFVQTGDIEMETPDNEYVSKLQFRVELDEDARMRISVQYDNESEWVEKCRINGMRKRSVTVPIIPKRCDHMRIRIDGFGGFRMYAFAKTLEQGSEL